MTKTKSPALGKGLEALLGDIKKNSANFNKNQSELNVEISAIPLDKIITNPNQPRTKFDETSLQELAQSIKENGVIVPVTVCRKDDKFFLIAGERRFRASKMAGLKEIPAYIRMASEQSTLMLALIENIQREDLNPIEIALCLKALSEQTGLSNEDLGKKLGKSRSSIANYIRLLNLPAQIQLSLRSDELSMGHAHALITIEDEKQQLDFARKIIQDNLSVRETEALTNNIKNASVTPKESKKKPLPELHNTFLKQMTEYLKTPITVKRSQRGKGTISISFKNDKEFQRIISLLENK